MSWIYDVILRTFLTVSHDNGTAAGATETFRRLRRSDLCVTQQPKLWTNGIFSSYFLPSVRGWPTRPTATQFFRRHLDRMFVVQATATPRRSWRETFDRRKSRVVSIDYFRDCLSRIFVIANNRLDVVVNPLTSSTYVTHHCSVNTEVPCPFRV